MVLVYCTSMGTQWWNIVGWVECFSFFLIGIAMFQADYTMAVAVVDMLGEDGNEMGASLLAEPLAAALPAFGMGTGGQEDQMPPSLQSPQQLKLEGITNFKFISNLLRTPVSPATAAELTRGFNVAKAQLVLYLAIVLFLYVALFFGFRSVEGYKVEQLLCVLGCCCSPLTAHLAAGWLLFINVPCQIATDRIRGHARRIREMRSVNTNGDSILGMVQEAHENTVRIAGVIRPPLVITWGVCWLIAGNLAANGIAPRDDIDPNSVGANALRILSPASLLISAASLVLAGMWPVLKPAEMTTACDELMAAISSLRCVPRAVLLEAEPSGRRKTDRLATPRKLALVQQLQEYAQGLNRGEGLGFCLRRKRVTTAEVHMVVLRVMGVCAIGMPCVHAAVNSNLPSAVIVVRALDGTLLLAMVLATGVAVEGARRCRRHPASWNDPELPELEW